MKIPLSCYTPLAIFALSLGGLHGEESPKNAQPPTNWSNHLQHTLTPYASIPFREVINATSGHNLLNWDGEERETLIAAAHDAVERIRRAEIRAPRINEIGYEVENVVLQALTNHGFTSSYPMTKSGKLQKSGYPDIEASKGDSKFYIEIKTFHAYNVNSLFRSFYYSPSKDSKITHDAFHLALGFAMVKNDDGNYIATGFKWLDLNELNVKLKYEFNASNRDLYGEKKNLVFASEETTQEPAEEDD